MASARKIERSFSFQSSSVKKINRMTSFGMGNRSCDWKAVRTDNHFHLFIKSFIYLIFTGGGGGGGGSGVCL